MKRFLVVITTLCICIPGCVKTKQPSGAIDAIDYMALQKKAESFIPAIGVYGGELVLDLLPPSP